jgi:membrane protein YqaA with SNARE-associated domain
MDYQGLLTATGLYVTTFVVCLVSAVVPLVHSETYLLAVSALTPPSAVVPVALLAAAGQMAGKTALYFVGRGALRLPVRRHEAKIEEWRARLERRKGRSDVLIFVSALGGFPPFYIVSVLAGVLRFSLREFLVWGSLGRSLRFGVVFAFPQLVKGLLA